MALEPIDPETAIELYPADRENELSEATLYSHRSRLGHFVRWCDEQDIENLNNLTGRHLHRYRLWRREGGDLSIASEKTQMDTLRVMVRWLEQIDGVEQDLSTKVTIEWKGRELGVPLSQSEPVDASGATEQAVSDWHYWLER